MKPTVKVSDMEAPVKNITAINMNLFDVKSNTVYSIELMTDPD